ncbi:hypothetical protein ABPG77_008205 [Micractinium sp. CCAP 211/92]
MAGLISEDGDSFKVSFPFGGQQHEVYSLRSLADAALVGMALAVRAAEELQAAPDAAAPGGHGQPSFRLPKAAGLDAPGLPPLEPAPFCQLVEQLQACVDWRNYQLMDAHEEQWARVPAPCPDLGRALPAALAHSHEQARQVVRRLPPEDVTRLHIYARALARLRRRVHVALPGDVTGRLLCMCLAD